MPVIGFSLLKDLTVAVFYRSIKTSWLSLALAHWSVSTVQYNSNYLWLLFKIKRKTYTNRQLRTGESWCFIYFNCSLYRENERWTGTSKPYVEPPSARICNIPVYVTDARICNVTLPPHMVFIAADYLPDVIKHARSRLHVVNKNDGTGPSKYKFNTP